MVVCVQAEDDDDALEAAELMSSHGAVDMEACGSTWQSQPAVAGEYAIAFGEYPAAPGRNYQAI